MSGALAFKFLLAVVMGGVIGLERESSMNENNTGAVGGIRTFALIALLGALAGVFYNQGIDAMFLIVSIFVFGMVGLYYYLGTSLTKRTGITTEISVIYTFIVGFLAVTDILPAQFVVALMVIVLLILSTKTKTRNLVKGMSHHEIESFIIYAIVALVILPFLPNESYYLTDIPVIKSLLTNYHISLGQYSTLEILNPYTLWFIVALITGIDVFGYILKKNIGPNSGLVATSLVGGFVSSTSTTISLAGHSKKKGATIDRLVGGAILANATSLILMTILIATLSPRLLVFSTPTILIMIAASIGIGVYYFTRKSKRAKKSQGTEEREIFSLPAAIKFAAILVGVRLITKVCLIIFGQGGFLASSALASFAGLDAIVINLSEIAEKNTITLKLGLLTFVIVSATNVLAKIFYASIQGDREFVRKFSWGMGIVTLVSLVGYFLA